MVNKTTTSDRLDDRAGEVNLEDLVWAALADVPDPEIPAVSVVDMGMIRDVSVVDGEACVTVLPTFTGCPAIDVILKDVAAAVSQTDGILRVTVDTSFYPPWTPDRITPVGRSKLEAFGIAPPAEGAPILIADIRLPEKARCPFCGSTETHNEMLFGPTPCRAVYYCDACRNPFEQFKPV